MDCDDKMDNDKVNTKIDDKIDRQNDKTHCDKQNNKIDVECVEKLKSTNISEDMIKIIIDKRERKLIQMMQEKNSDFNLPGVLNKKSNIVYEELPVGDILIYYNSDLISVIERKTINDLARSIIDKRYQSQTYRLKKYCISNGISVGAIEIIVEGFFSGIDSSSGKLVQYSSEDLISGIKYKALNTLIVNAQTRDQFTVVHTNGLCGTFTYLLNKCKCLLKYPYKGVRTVQDSESSKQINDFVRSNVRICKKANVTPENCFLNQLSIIPGISIKKAKLICEKFSNFNELIAGYNKMTTSKEKEELLIMCGLGKVLSKRIYEYIFYK